MWASAAGVSKGEALLKGIKHAPCVLHIATHGYFCEQSDANSMANPLLRSGLILAGANRTIGHLDEPTSSSEDGILTALEASGLNLGGTDLVVLSACQTGLGDVQSGEGVFGLRRAFQLAGARSVVVSLFEIPDEQAFQLMKLFYTNWLEGQSKPTALRHASLSRLERCRRNNESENPLFWGGFVVVGKPD